MGILWMLVTGAYVVDTQWLNFMMSFNLGIFSSLEIDSVWALYVLL